MAIGLVVTLAVTTVLIKNEGAQRTSVAINDASQTVNYMAFSIDREIRSSGTGFAQFRKAMGCEIHAAAGTAQILPPPAPLPAPFDTIGTATVPIRLAPVVIVDGGADSDKLIVMGGSHAGSQNALVMKPNTAKAASIGVASTFDLTNGDMVIVAETTPGGKCMVQEVDKTNGSTIEFGGTYFKSVSTGGVSLATMGDKKMAAVLPIGRNSMVAAAQPSFFAYAINSQKQLVRYNLLNPNPTPTVADVTPIAENIVMMKAIYGTGTATSPLGDPSAVPTVLMWGKPTGTLAATSMAGGLLVDGTILANKAAAEAAQLAFSTIKAVRVAIVIRSPILEKEKASPSSLSLFQDLPTPITYTLPAGDEFYRHRIVETLIPIRNM